MRLAALILLSPLLLLANAAQAGSNAGGTLIVHAAPPVTGSPCGEGDHNFCSLTDECVNLSACADAITRHDGGLSTYWYVLAAFPPSATPRLRGVTFGLDYSPSVALVGQSNCANFELTTSGWPQSGSGTALSWNSTQTAPLVMVYWFAGYNYYSPDTGYFRAQPHPTQGGFFADDSTPSVTDPIADYGVLGFNQDGYLPCPTLPTPTGACCSPICECTVLTADECMAQGNSYQGDGTSCDPNPCSCPPPTGACCLADGSCTMKSQYDCEGGGGTYLGDYVPCSSESCVPIPARGSSWGAIKSRYRG
ncbi:MAG: hypothetical protein U0527_00165 [Candidatus Eisenbacteria bacterium]